MFMHLIKLEVDSDRILAFFSEAGSQVLRKCARSWDEIHEKSLPPDSQCRLQLLG